MSQERQHCFILKTLSNTKLQTSHIEYIYGVALVLKDLQTPGPCCLWSGKVSRSKSVMLDVLRKNVMRQKKTGNEGEGAKVLP